MRISGREKSEGLGALGGSKRGARYNGHSRNRVDHHWEFHYPSNPFLYLLCWHWQHLGMSFVCASTWNSRYFRAVGWLLMAASFAGCKVFDADFPASTKSPLQPARQAPGSVTLEIYWARYPLHDNELDRAVWNEVDESQVDSRVRRQLAKHGFRAGVVSSMIPEDLAELLSIQYGDEPIQEEPTDNQQQTADLLADSKVNKQRKQLPAETRWELFASEVLPELPLLLPQQGELSGRVYRHAQAVYAIQLLPQADGRVELQLSPELHHGKPTLRYTGGTGILRQAPMRDREVYPELRTSVLLSPGEMLLMTGLPEPRSRLGDCFHAIDGPAGKERKLVVIRLAQFPDSPAFAEK